jgi:hypothetical protein
MILVVRTDLSKSVKSKRKSITVDKAKKQFLKELHDATDEIDVQFAYRGYLKLIALGAKTITSKTHKESKNKTDAILDYDGIKTLIECKYNKKFDDKKIKCTALAQAVMYLKGFQDEGIGTNIVFIGNEKECFFLPTRLLEHYFSISNKTFYDEIKWNEYSPSQPDPKLIEFMIKDEELDKQFIMKIADTTFSLKRLLPIMVHIGKNSNVKIPITENNILMALHFFQHNVITDAVHFGQNDLWGVQKRVERIVDLFYNCITYPSMYIDRKRKILISRGDEIKINVNQYDAFFNLFDLHYKPEERDNLVCIKDRLMETIARRRTGAFFTPFIWTKKAHDMISEQFGNDWRTKFVVWDCASGTNNLTRGWGTQFNELYNSTLEQGDIDTVLDMKYGGIVFKFDFLNDCNEKLHPYLLKALRDKKDILFLLNPPYATAGGMVGGKGKGTKTGVAKTLMGKLMREEGFGKSSQQIFAQFFYRIIKYKKEFNVNVKICIFVPPLFMSGEWFDLFREKFYKEFEFKDGILFPASEFEDVKEGWGDSFTIWSSKMGVV